MFIVNRDGRNLRQLTDWPGEDGWPAWSPDGKSIAFTTTHNVRSGLFDTWVMRADGRGKRRLAHGGFPVWSPDGRVIMVARGPDSEHLAVVRRDGSGLRAWPIRGELPDWHSEAAH